MAAARVVARAAVTARGAMVAVATAGARVVATGVATAGEAMAVAAVWCYMGTISTLGCWTCYT
jgi:EAL domain-containing protein (putative c-di-GMP-specific phosphodiesterase class I)